MCYLTRQQFAQPPSGGCVLKLEQNKQPATAKQAATFGWLCVETFSPFFRRKNELAATFGWLCVETSCCRCPMIAPIAAAFGRLCVETIKALLGFLVGERQPSSCGCVLKRPQLLYFLPTYPAAAFARLCVETIKIRLSPMYFTSCRLRAAVC